MIQGECYVIFPDSEYVPDILKLIEDPQWVGIHIHLTLDRPQEGDTLHSCLASRG